MCDFIGLQYVSSTLERLVLFLYPTFVLLFSALLFRRRVAGREWLALSLCYLGAGLAVTHDWQALGAGSNVLLGVSWVLASALSYSLYLIGVGELVKQAVEAALAVEPSTLSTVVAVAGTPVWSLIHLNRFKQQVKPVSE